MSEIDDGVINIAEHPKLIKELKLVKESSAKYLYNERTTKALTIVAEILRDAGANNRGYQQTPEVLDS